MGAVGGTLTTLAGQSYQYTKSTPTTNASGMFGCASEAIFRRFQPAVTASLAPWPLEANDPSVEGAAGRLGGGSSRL